VRQDSRGAAIKSEYHGLIAVGTDGALVAPAVFKTVCVHVTHGWLGSIPRRSRNMPASRRHIKMTTLVAALLLAIRVFVLLPVAHDGHCPAEAPRCDCSRDAAHFHHTDPRDEHHDCVACQLLAQVTVPVEAIVLSPVSEWSSVKTCDALPKSFTLVSTRVRAPPIV